MSAAPGPSARQALEPCPFCGGAAYLNAFYAGRTRDEVKCSVCEAVSPPTENDTEAEAVAAWNRRPADPAVAELVEALRRSYDRLGDAADRINTLPRVADTLLEVNLRQERARIESLIAKHAAKP